MFAADLHIAQRIDRERQGERERQQAIEWANKPSDPRKKQKCAENVISCACVLVCKYTRTLANEAENQRNTQNKKK